MAGGIRGDEGGRACHLRIDYDNSGRIRAAGLHRRLVGAFFLPFALTVSFALVASLLVALTAVPVLGAFLLRPGDLPEGAGDEGDIPMQETWLQRTYLVILKWALGTGL